MRQAAALGALIIVLDVGGARAAAQPLTELRVADLGTRPAKVAGYGDVLAWSAWDVEQHRFRLVVRIGNGPPRRVRVAGRQLPFDVDVGPDRNGRPVVVYSRCRSEPSGALRRDVYDENSELVRYDAASGCDLFTYSPLRRREHRVAGVSTPAGSEYLPSVWRGNIAFARRGSPIAHARLYLRLHGTRRSHLLTGGPTTRGRPAQDGPVSLDLRGTRLAYHWARLVNNCDDPSRSIGTGTLPLEEQIRVAQPGRAVRRLSPVTCSDEDVFSAARGVTWAGADVVFALERNLGSARTGTLIARGLNGAQRSLGEYAFSASVRYLTNNASGFHAMLAPPLRRDHRISRLLNTPT